MHLQARRHALAEQANAHDRQLYETKQAQLEYEIEQAQVALTASKIELQEAREEKQRKNECEVCWAEYAELFAELQLPQLRHVIGAFVHGPDQCVVADKKAQVCHTA